MWFCPVTWGQAQRVSVQMSTVPMEAGLAQQPMAMGVLPGDSVLRGYRTRHYK